MPVFYEEMEDYVNWKFRPPCRLLFVVVRLVAFGSTTNVCWLMDCFKQSQPADNQLIGQAHQSVTPASSHSVSQSSKQ